VFSSGKQLVIRTVFAGALCQGSCHLSWIRQEFDVTAGAQITVPKGVLYGMLTVAEELIVYDVFAPPAF